MHRLTLAHHVTTNATQWLWQGSKEGDFEGCKRLLEKGVDPSHPHGGATALHVAAPAGRVDIVDLLLKHGAIVDAPIDPWYEGDLEGGMTALHLAVREGQEAVCAALLSAGANAGQDSWFPHLIRPIHCVFERVQGRSVHCLKLLIKHGADPNARAGPEEGGRTPLHYAVRDEWEDAAIILLKHGCRTDMKDEKDQTALEMAAEVSPVMHTLLLKYASNNVVRSKL
jgi:ankyrin repeat protein